MPQRPLPPPMERTASLFSFSPARTQFPTTWLGRPIPTSPVDITGIIDAFDGIYNGSPVGGTPELIPFTITAVQAEPASDCWSSNSRRHLIARTAVVRLGALKRFSIDAHNVTPGLHISGGFSYNSSQSWFIRNFTAAAARTPRPSCDVVESAGQTIRVETE